MSLYRFNVTTPDGQVLTTVAKDAAQAKEKAWHRLSSGVPFLAYSSSALKVKKLEVVNGPRLLFPEYLKGA